MTKGEFFKMLKEMPLKDLAKKIDKCDSITVSFVMLKKYIPRKIQYSETLVANDINEDIDFEELAISLMEDLQRCFNMLVITGNLSASKRLSLDRAIKYFSYDESRNNQ